MRSAVQSRGQQLACSSCVMAPAAEDRTGCQLASSTSSACRALSSAACAIWQSGPLRDSASSPISQLACASTYGEGAAASYRHSTRACSNRRVKPSEGRLAFRGSEASEWLNRSLVPRLVAEGWL
eukprot:101458-Pyramimonas_sp.AAC.1